MYRLSQAKYTYIYFQNPHMNWKIKFLNKLHIKIHLKNIVLLKIKMHKQ